MAVTLVVIREEAYPDASAMPFPEIWKSARENHLRTRQLMPHAFGMFRFAVFALALGRAAMTAASALLSSALPSSAGLLVLDGVRR